MAKDAKWYAEWLRLATAPTEDEIRFINEIADFIENLAAELGKVKRERDALLKYFTDSHWAACDICKHEPESHDINDCMRIRQIGIPCFEWRGLSEV